MELLLELIYSGSYTKFRINIIHVKELCLASDLKLLYLLVFIILVVALINDNIVLPISFTSLLFFVSLEVED